MLFGQPAKPITITLAPRKPCSVPLVNVLRVEPRDPIQVPVKKPEKFTMPHVSLPAPPCDNLK